jgi:hypothetical protein
MSAAAAPISTNPSELLTRIADGIHVRLLWNRGDGRATVAVADARSGEEFSVEVREGDRALDIFHHPFAYAAWRRIRP